MGAFLRRARAIEIRCIWPPDRRTPALADDRVVAASEFRDEVVRMGRARRRLDPASIGIRVADLDIRRHGVVEKKDVLQDKANGAMQVVEGEVTNVDTAQSN